MRLRSVVLAVLLCACGGNDSAPPPASPTTTSSSSSSTSATASATPATSSSTPVAHGLTEHQCSDEGRGFDCTGCKTQAPPASNSSTIAEPQCLRVASGKSTTCPRVCCGLCPKE